VYQRRRRLQWPSGLHGSQRRTCLLLVAPSPPRGRGAKYCDERVCLSVRSHSSKTTRPNFTRFLCMLTVAVARSSSDGVTIRYVLPVLWMTACFHTMGPMGKNQARRREEVWRLAVRVGRQDNCSLWSSSSECGLEVCYLRLTCCSMLATSIAIRVKHQSGVCLYVVCRIDSWGSTRRGHSTFLPVCSWLSCCSRLSYRLLKWYK